MHVVFVPRIDEQHADQRENQQGADLRNHEHRTYPRPEIALLEQIGLLSAAGAGEEREQHEDHEGKEDPGLEIGKRGDLVARQDYRLILPHPGDEMRMITSYQMFRTGHEHRIVQTVIQLRGICVSPPVLLEVASFVKRIRETFGKGHAARRGDAENIGVTAVAAHLPRLQAHDHS